MACKEVRSLRVLIAIAAVAGSVHCGESDPESLSPAPGARRSETAPAADSRSDDSGGDPASAPPSTPGGETANTRPPAPSKGCAGAPPGGDIDLQIQSGGRARTARVHLPPKYDGKTPLALLLNYHGRMSSASQEELVSGTTPKADSAGFIVAYPSGVGSTWNGGMCCGQAQSANVDDVGFTRDLLDEIEARLCVDRRRVFATGLSNGAFMVNRLGCELSDRIAAIAPVAGPLMMAECKPKHPVPIMEFHGTADAVVPYGGTFGFFGVESSIADWAKRNGCTGKATQTYSKGDTTCTTFGGCNANADVTLCTTQGGGHQWPGGMAVPALGKKTDDIRATDAMWTFFEAHPMPE